MKKSHIDFESFPNHSQEIVELKKMGFLTNPYNKEVETVEEVWDFSREIIKKRDEFPYQIDGLVVKINDNKIAEEVAIVGKTPRSWSAIKFPAEESSSHLKSITWQVGRTGKLTPVAELEKVELAGTIVRRATLHNVQEVLEQDYHINDTLIVRKAGDIIPEVVSILKNLRIPNNLKPVEIPENCPSCDSKLKKSTTNVDLVCTNDNCKEQVLLRLSYYTSRNIANIDGLNKKSLEKMIEAFDIKDIQDLYKLPYNKIFDMESFGAKSVQNLEKSIKKSQEIESYKFLTGLGIDGVGPEVAKLILKATNFSNPREGLTTNDENENLLI